jgi:hypothetical protein
MRENGVQRELDRGLVDEACERLAIRREPLVRGIVPGVCNEEEA